LLNTECLTIRELAKKRPKTKNIRQADVFGFSLSASLASGAKLQKLNVLM
jgi:hypothetical protein